MFCQWNDSSHEDHVILLASHKGEILEEDEAPKEVSLLMVPPASAARHRREFEIEWNPADHDRSVDEQSRSKLQFKVTDCRTDPFHYLLLHCHGELGWGLSTCHIQSEKQHQSRKKNGTVATLDDYYRYRILSADFVELFSESHNPDESEHSIKDGLVLAPCESVSGTVN
eukprot:3352912-Rhodomonas_salina.1